MNDAGYTLTEMLAALVMIGLAATGLAEGVHVISVIQASAARTVSDGRATRAAQMSMERLFAGQGPFMTEGGARFVGSADRFAFDCGAARDCRAALAPAGAGLALSTVSGPNLVTVVGLPTPVRRAGFVYGSSMGVGDRWPPLAPGRQTLHWVGLRAGEAAAAAPIAVVRLWTEQPRHCAFDVVAQRCRDAAP